MSDEYIKEILIALINNGQIATGVNNKTIAENIALFIKTLKQELKEDGPLGKALTFEEIAAQIPDLIIPE